jgi:hypothetical protein
VRGDGDGSSDSEEGNKRDMEYLTHGSMRTCGPKPSGNHQNQAKASKLTVEVQNLLKFVTDGKIRQMRRPERYFAPSCYKACFHWNLCEKNYSIYP